MVDCLHEKVEGGMSTMLHYKICSTLKTGHKNADNGHNKHGRDLFSVGAMGVGTHEF